jgi:RimJ/RimL family protein N-acetyltransferase
MYVSKKIKKIQVINETKNNQNIKLENISEKDFDAILDITSSPDVMKNIGNGKIWDNQKVKRFIDYCVKDSRLPDASRTQYYYKIIFNDLLIGIIGFHTFYKKELPTTPSDFYLTVYMDKNQQGKGYYSSALQLLLKKIKESQPRKTRLYSLVRNTNIKMIQISNNKYDFVKEILLNGEVFTLYSININRTFKSRKNKKTKKLDQKTQTSKHYYLTSTKNISQKRIDSLFNKRGNWIKLPKSSKSGKTNKCDFIFIDRINNEDKKT